MKKILFVLIIGAFVAPMFIKGPDGKPIVAISDFLPSKPDVSMGAAAPAGYYRYQDSEGNWQYSDRVPEGVAYETIEVDTQANIIQAVQPVQKEVPSAPEAPAPGVAGYVDNLKNVRTDAENVQNLMDERESKLQDALNSIQ